jgi:hypothetical protein
MRKITKKIFVHISQTDNIIILIDNQVLDSDIIIEGFETPYFYIATLIQMGCSS